VNNKPKISIITPTRRRPDLLYRCIKAIQLSTLQEYEHIIVGDNCTYAKQVCDLFLDDKRIKYYETPSPHIWNAGASGKNIGISKSTTEYIVYCDDDNIMLPNHLEVMYNELSSGTPICRSLLYEINLPKGAGSIKKVLEFPITNPSLQGGKPHRNDMQCIGHTKEAIKAVGYWNTAEQIQNDTSWSRTATSEDDYLLKKFKNKFGPNFYKDLPDITFLYYGRAACQNLDNDYDSRLENNKLFIYPNLISKY